MKKVNRQSNQSKLVSRNFPILFYSVERKKERVREGKCWIGIGREGEETVVKEPDAEVSVSG
jgi:hypothetical protein